MKRLLAASALAWLASACGPPTYGDFLDEVDSAWCDRELRCGLRSNAETGCTVPPPVIVARSRVDIQRSIDAKHMRYEPLNAKRCIEAVHKSPCDPIAMALAVGDACETVTAPRVEAYGECLGQDECLGGRCVVAAGACRGACEPYVPVGADCTSDAAVCDPTVHFCDGAHCRARRDRGDACDDDSMCRHELRCVDGACASQPRPKRGEPCDATLRICRDADFCDNGTCMARAADGATCARADACRSGSVCAGYDLDVAGVCRQPSSLGGPCTAAAMVTGCALSSVCDNGVCVAGEPFAGWNETCAIAPCIGDELICRSSVCVLPSGVGGICALDDDCQSGLACVDRQCVPNDCSQPT